MRIVAVLCLAASLPASGVAGAGVTSGVAGAGVAVPGVAAGDVAGRWEGTVTIADREVPVAFDLEPSAGGGWVGSAVLSGLGVKGAALSSIVVAPPGVSFALAQGEQGVSATVEARVEAPGRLAGTLSHAGRTSPLVLRRTGDPQVDRPLAGTPVAAAAVGEWQGEYELFGYPRKVTLKLANEAKTARASFVIVGKKNNDLPVDLVRQEGDTLFVVSTASGIRFEGRLAPAGDTIAGSVLQGPLEIPLTLRRAQGGSVR